MKRSIMFLLMASMLGCSSATGEATVPSVLGAWAYSARRTTGGTGLVMYAGRLEFRQQLGMAFDGNFSASALDAQGTTQLVTGFFSGSFISAEGVDFDVEVGGETLRHVGRVRNDSIVGTWLSSAGNSQGSFAAVRDRP